MGLSEEQLREEQASIREEAEYWTHWGATGLFGHGLGIIGSLT